MTHRRINNPLKEQDLDHLLKEMALENFAQEKIINDTDMYTKFLMSIPVTGTLNEREVQLIRKLEMALNQKRNSLKKWLWLILVLLLISALLSIFKKAVNNEPEVKNLKRTEIMQSNLIPESETAVIEDSVISIQYSYIKTETVEKTDSSSQLKTETMFSEAKENFMPAKIIESEYFPEALYAVKDPVINIKSDPDNYKKYRINKDLASNCALFNRVCFRDSEIKGQAYRGEPFSKGMEDFVYINYAGFIEEQPKAWLPQAVLWHLDPAMLSTDGETEFTPGSADNFIYNGNLPESIADMILQPFYFRKFEVTNKEYKEFLNHVRASNGFEKVMISTTRFDSVEVQSGSSTTGAIKKGDKYYQVTAETKHLVDYNRVFRYHFRHITNEISSYVKDGINVYPDTTSWTRDFEMSFNKPMEYHYFSHPAYDNYPVTGVSWLQAMAFLDWKTSVHQAQLDSKNIPLIVSYELPDEIQWELASQYDPGKTPEFNPVYTSSAIWFTDLGVSVSRDPQVQHRTDYLKSVLIKETHVPYNFIIDGVFHTGPADLAALKKSDPRMMIHLDKNKISWMGGNVSEWMKESFPLNRKPYFEMHIEKLRNSGDASLLAAGIEEIFHNTNHPDGRLVKGANWYDERFGEKARSGKNVEGMSTCRFLDPQAQHSTVGFRYVVVVREK